MIQKWNVVCFIFPEVQIMYFRERKTSQDRDYSYEKWFITSVCD